MRETVTGMLVVKNGEKYIRKCLESMDFCDELVVVDAESTDRTREIAEEMGARIYVRPWPGPIDQFNYALSKVRTDWVVSLDHDEWLDDELKQNVINVLEKKEDIAGYMCSRKSFYYNRFMMHSGWYPDKLLRVFRTERMEIGGMGGHQEFFPQGETKELSGDIIHYPYESFEHHTQKINYYAEIGAKSLREKGRKGGLTRAILHAHMRFIKLYFLKLGILDGKAGYINAMAGFYYVFQKYLRVNDTVEWGTE